MKHKRNKMSIRRRKRMMYLYTGFLLLLSVAVAAMPVGNANKDNTRLILYFTGAAFWIGTVGTICMAFKINYCRKHSSDFGQSDGGLKQLGLIRFFQNKEATVMDFLMFCSVIGFLIAKLSANKILIPFIFLAMFVFTFGMHCMLNGVNYKFLNYKVRRDEK